MNSKVQVRKEHYFSEGYNDIFRFQSYYHQIRLVLGSTPITILEIGQGNKFVSDYLKKNGLSVKTCDIDRRLKPDIVGDITKLPIKSNAFDTVTAFEVLEHIPFEKVPSALAELHRVSKKYVIVSVPYPCIHLSAAIKFPLVNLLIKEPVPNFSIRIPKFWQKHSFDGEHYWELGKSGYPKKVLRELFEKRFQIIEESHPFMNPYHEFFLLKKK